MGCTACARRMIAGRDLGKSQEADVASRTEGAPHLERARGIVEAAEGGLPACPTPIDGA